MQEMPESGNGEYHFTCAGSGTAPIDLVELAIWPPPQGQRDRLFPVWVDLRLGDQVLPHLNDWRVTVYLTGVELVADLEGCEFAPGSLYGDEAHPQIEKTTEKELRERDISGSGEADAKLGVGILQGVTASANFALKGEAKTRSKIEQARETELFEKRVTTLPNGRWEIKEFRGSLDGTYLRIPAEIDEGTKPLCKLQATSTNLTVTLTLEAWPQHIQTDITPLNKAARFLWNGNAKSKPNKTAIIKRLIAMACTRRLLRRGDERVPLARAILKGTAEVVRNASSK
jgi:hypothetical protein